MEKNTKLLFDTSAWLDDVDSREVYEDYVDECGINGCKPAPMDSDAFREWCIDLERENMHDDLDNIRHAKHLAGPWLISGTVGAWDGKHTVVPVVESSLDKAILRCAEDDTRVEYDSEGVTVTASHHDGTNVFTLRKLSPRAAGFVADGWDDMLIRDVSEGNDAGYFEKLPEYLF